MPRSSNWGWARKRGFNIAEHSLSLWRSFPQIYVSGQLANESGDIEMCMWKIFGTLVELRIALTTPYSQRALKIYTSFCMFCTVELPPTSSYIYQNLSISHQLSSIGWLSWYVTVLIYPNFINSTHDIPQKLQKHTLSPGLCDMLRIITSKDWLPLSILRCQCLNHQLSSIQQLSIELLHVTDVIWCRQQITAVYMIYKYLQMIRCPTTSK